MSVATQSPWSGLHDRIGRFFFGYRDYLAPLCGILLLILAQPRPFLVTRASTRGRMPSGCWSARLGNCCASP